LLNIKKAPKFADLIKKFMKIGRILFLSVFGAFQIVVFILTIFIDSRKNDLNFLLGLFEKITWFKYGAFIGILLVAIEFIWVRNDSKNSDDI
jgi:hypothetical protein